MAIDHVDRTVVTTAPAADATSAGNPASASQVVQTEHGQVTHAGPGRPEMSRRIAIFAFGLIQLVIGARIVLLLLDAREANGLVSGVLNLSQLFVGPFEGILRTNALHASGSTLDITAFVALIGWTVVELVVIWAVGIFRREQA